LSTKPHLTVDHFLAIMVKFPEKDAFWGKGDYMLPARVSQGSIVQSNKKALVLSAAAAGEPPKYFTSNEVFRRFFAMDCVRSTTTPIFLCLFLWRTGCRISEALKVIVADLDLANKVIRIHTLKRKGHVRFVPLQTEFIGEIAIWINQNQVGRIDKLFPIERKTGYNWVSAACKDAFPGDERNHPHTFRHSFAVNCLTQGVPITTVQNWLGHADLGKTLIYTQLVAADTRIFMDNIQF